MRLSPTATLALALEGGKGDDKLPVGSRAPRRPPFYNTPSSLILSLTRQTKINKSYRIYKLETECHKQTINDSTIGLRTISRWPFLLLHQELLSIPRTS